MSFLSYIKKRMYQLNPGEGWIQEFFVGEATWKKITKEKSALKINDFSFEKFENTPSEASTNPKKLNSNKVYYQRGPEL